MGIGAIERMPGCRSAEPCVRSTAALGSMRSIPLGLDRCAPLLRNDRQDHARWVVGVMENGLSRRLERLLKPERTARIGVDVEAREIRRRDVDSNLVPPLEGVARRVQGDRELVRFPRLHELGVFEGIAVTGADDRVANIQLVAVRVIVVRRVYVD